MNTVSWIANVVSTRLTPARRRLEAQRAATRVAAGGDVLEQVAVLVAATPKQTRRSEEQAAHTHTQNRPGSTLT